MELYHHDFKICMDTPWSQHFSFSDSLLFKFCHATAVDENEMNTRLETLSSTVCAKEQNSIQIATC